MNSFVVTQSTLLEAATRWIGTKNFSSKRIYIFTKFVQFNFSANAIVTSIKLNSWLFKLFDEVSTTPGLKNIEHSNATSTLYKLHCITTTQMPNSRRNDNVRFNWVYVFSGVLCWLHSVQTMELRFNCYKLWLFFGNTKNCVISLISNAFYSQSRNSLTFYGT